MIKQELLDILACPKCKGPVGLHAEQVGIVCRTCQLVYAIRDGIPIMLIDEAKSLVAAAEGEQDGVADEASRDAPGQAAS